MVVLELLEKVLGGVKKALEWRGKVQSNQEKCAALVRRLSALSAPLEKLRRRRQQLPPRGKGDEKKEEEDEDETVQCLELLLEAVEQAQTLLERCAKSSTWRTWFQVSNIKKELDAVNAKLTTCRGDLQLDLIVSIAVSMGGSGGGSSSSFSSSLPSSSSAVSDDSKDEEEEGQNVPKQQEQFAAQHVSDLQTMIAQTEEELRARQQQQEKQKEKQNNSEEEKEKEELKTLVQQLSKQLKEAQASKQALSKHLEINKDQSEFVAPLFLSLFLSLLFFSF